VGRHGRRRSSPDGAARAGTVARLKRGVAGKASTARATSAGGIVVRFTDRGPELLLGRRNRPREGAAWTLPKGTPNLGETLEETALREVREETGYEVRIVEPVGAIEYYFARAGTRVHKTVHHFLMEAIGGDLSGHDDEFDEVRWVPWSEAISMMSYETERSIVERSLSAAQALRPRAGA
jgi:8-oxo-dGTP pyrophosphatase MutT (NUDIX family)